jgi:eukaryotic-like serine/threonine-protein kinase
MPKKEPVHLDTASVFAQRYEIVRCIADGGMGTVYEAIHLETKRRRALKIMAPEQGRRDDLRKKVEREATIMAEVQSEHIAEVLDAGVDGESGCPYIVMELLRGEELGDMLTRCGHLPPEEVVLYLAQAALALDKTHAAGVVHRDLKPANLFVTYRDDGSPCVKLLDFGIAKALMDDSSGDERTTKGILGTPLYLAPEQIRGLKRQSGRTDVYSLGQIAYTLLTGAPYWKHDPTEDENLYGRLVAMAEGAAEPARQRAARHSTVELPAPFDAWFAKATAVEPANRYGSCAELVIELAAAFGQEAPAFLRQPAAARTAEGLRRAGGWSAAPGARSGLTGSDTTGATTGHATARTARDVSPSVSPPGRRPLGLRRSAWLGILAGAIVLGAVLIVLRPGAGARDQAPGAGSGATLGSGPSSATPTGESAREHQDGPSAAPGASSSAAATGAPTSEPGATATGALPIAASAGASARRAPHLDPARPPATGSAKGWVPPVTER